LFVLLARKNENVLPGHFPGSEKTKPRKTPEVTENNAVLLAEASFKSGFLFKGQKGRAF